MQSSNDTHIDGTCYRTLVYRDNLSTSVLGVVQILVFVGVLAQQYLLRRQVLAVETAVDDLWPDLREAPWHTLPPWIYALILGCIAILACNMPPVGFTTATFNFVACMVLRGDNAAAKKLVTPASILIMIVFAVCSMVLGAVNIGFSQSGPGHPYPEASVSVPAAIVLAFGWGVYHFALEGVAVYLCMHGCGVQSLRRVAVIAGSIAFAVFVLQALAFLSPRLLGSAARGFYIQIAYEAVLFGGYLAYLVAPYAVLRRRPAMVMYSLFWTVYRPLNVANLALMFNEVDVGFCLYIASTWVVFGLCKPVILYMVLRRDSQYWQGLIEDSFYERPLKSRPSTANIRTPLLSTFLDPGTAQALASQMDNLQRTCNIINFAAVSLGDDSLSLGQRSLLGAGGTARVFRGWYQGRRVAVKMLYCMTLTPETVHNFCEESALLSSLRHPNVVQVEGVCVLPPCVSIVLELCRGSLFELLRIDAGAALAWDVRLGWAIDCSRAVACLHAQAPPVLHMDLKSSNFLVGECRVHTWAPVDVARWLATCGVPRPLIAPFLEHGVTGVALLALTPTALARIVGLRGTLLPQYSQLVTLILELIDSCDPRETARGVIKITDLELSKTKQALTAQVHVHDVPQTMNWTAPEVILFGKNAYSAASDIYALGMVFWEILTGQVPFDEPGVSPPAVGELVTKFDRRPPIPADTPPEFTALLQRCWARDAAARPCAALVTADLVLMRRRWQAHRTLDEGRFAVLAAPSGATSEAAFVDVRFGAPEPARRRLMSASGHSMGSLHTLASSADEASVRTSTEDEPCSGTASPVPKGSPPSQRSGSTRSRTGGVRRGHSRTRSEGHALATTAGTAAGAADDSGGHSGPSTPPPHRFRHQLSRSTAGSQETVFGLPPVPPSPASALDACASVESRARVEDPFLANDAGWQGSQPAADALSMNDLEQSYS